MIADGFAAERLLFRLHKLQVIGRVVVGVAVPAEGGFDFFGQFKVRSVADVLFIGAAAALTALVGYVF